MSKLSKNNVEQFGLFSKIPIIYNFGEYLLAKIKEDVKSILGNSEVAIRGQITEGVRRKLNSILELRNLKADISDNKIVISQKSLTDRDGEYDTCYG